MKPINLYDAKTQLSALVSAAQRGEEVIIARNGEPLVQLVPVSPKPRSASFGLDKGLVTIAEDFDEAPQDFEDYIR